jgi:aquaporin Z
MTEATSDHWREYLMEAAGLGIFMISACVFTTAIEHPGSPVRQGISNAFLRRILIGVAMGLTAIGLIYSPWGKQSGAHLNPSVTITFYRLGKLTRADALFYVLAQFLGADVGVLVSTFFLGHWISHPAVNYAVTVPGFGGARVAFMAEFAISFVLMTVILFVSNSATFPAFTGILAGILVATYISLEAPLSGMSMNPARTFGSALSAQVWKGWWIYFTAPPIGMLAAAEFYQRLHGAHRVLCAKLHHQNDKRCIFHCGYRQMIIPSLEDVLAQPSEQGSLLLGLNRNSYVTKSVLMGRRK